ncbi:hypothetical protein [Bacillus halotolerans]|uniref:hypothetical protein n=1 Tax=Bacillus halotolerans TaxID=260554 RepID=UPI002281F9C5|nr:hypothetical protein [Bacillus halotolerans]MCY8472405.1 hypothetical protein [Bacillus halotolerans]
MAHLTEVVGKYSELIARAALMASGWEAISKAETEEPFDISARDPGTGAWCTFQVKTIAIRDDRNGELKVNGRKGNGKPYIKSDADYFIGVLVGGGDGPKAWMFENRGITEYWGPQSGEGKRWIEMDLDFRREDFAENNEAEAV